jgi:hypothetical protein
MHILDFFSFLVVGVGAGVGADNVFKGESDGWMGTNSPDATSSDARPCGSLGDEENHPPGKKRDEVVDSSRVRVVAGEVVSNRVVPSVPSVLVISSTGAKRGRVGLGTD